MVVVVAGDFVDGEFFITRVAQQQGVDRVVLIHEQGVEKPVVTGDSVDVGQPQVLVLERVVVGVVQLFEQIGGGGCGRDGRPHRHGVDE
ncbi:hypothetical protein LAUMK191_05654 [Mycobacterium attenuatum]|uniref:Uncharacterized protein n=1 Tax=Mycobacterium attenuatum TaxID=2341086 RepID=A0A498QFS3_9MYCO|nr:hypothetical protein LAUMK136_05633 [Mycobacterium attenuatum]VBA60703.1 hypothetical protein LAUMK191_05654 [Mycobacterium attenuatum]VBA62396.1 hypothetical protein LAUMK41_05787 [Mycobacterium attenuatum]